MTVLSFNDGKWDIVTENWTLGAKDPEGWTTISYPWSNATNSGMAMADLNIRSKYVKGYIFECAEKGKKVVDLTGSDFNRFVAEFNKSLKANFPSPG